MKRVGYIYEKIYDMDNLIEAHKQARKGKGHYQAVKNTDAHLEERLQEIQTMLKDGTYVVGEYKT